MQSNHALTYFQFVELLKQSKWYISFVAKPQCQNDKVRYIKIVTITSP